MLKIIGSLLIISASAFAAGDGHHAGPMDLIPPAINFVLLTGFLIYKIKGPLGNHFTQRAILIQETVERASVKAKEAKIKMEAQQNKMNNLAVETESILKRAEKDYEEFKVNYDKELASKLDKLQKDSISKVEAEKKGMYESLNKEIIDEVLEKAKLLVAGNSDLKNKINTSVIKGL